MLKEGLKQNIVLILFCFLMREYLSSATLGFVLSALILMAFNIKVNKIIRNIIAIGVFASYWLTYGKLIDPEIGVNFLTSIITLKILEKETVRDRYMIFFGLLLLISAGSLFEKTLTYVFFFAGSFLALITDFYSYLNQKWRLKDLGLSLLWVFPLTFLMFFIVPRMMSPVPFQDNRTAPGEIGYTPDVNISEIESLVPNEAPVFHAILGDKMRRSDLYWRGNTLTFTDGWNWRTHIHDREEAEEIPGLPVTGREVKQSIRLLQKPDYFFSMDYPSYFTYGDTVKKPGPLARTLTQRRWEWVQRYDVYSDPSSSGSLELPAKSFVQVPLPKKVRQNIDQMFQGQTLDEISQSVRSHFLKEGYSYSLSPGRSETILDFMQKKTGFCSHYASALALILRVKGIPARLVSGYMGGEYNRFADFYLVTQNDAHVWVEALENGSWKRIDPTEWIAPDRVELGGEAYMENVSAGAFRKNSFFKLPAAFNDFRQWFGQWDFLFYQWIEEMDYHSQEAWFTRFNFKRTWVFVVIPFIMLSFMLLYIRFLNRGKKSSEEFPYQDLWNEFFNRMDQRGLKLSRVSIRAVEEVLSQEKDPAPAAIWAELLAASFQNKKINASEIRKQIRKLNQSL